MFKKLLKHDFKAVFRYWWLLLPTLPIVFTALGLAIRFLIMSTESGLSGFPIVEILLFLFVIFAVILLSASTLVTPILSFIRFYKHFFTDEGYLTFTLPVRRSTLLLSKLVNALIFDAMYAVLMILGAFIVLLIAPPTPVLPDMFRVLAMTWQVGAWNVLYILEWIVLFVLLDLFSNLLLYLCVTVGALIVKKAKLVVGLVLYYGVYTVLSTVLQVLTSIVLPLSAGELVTLIDGLSRTALLGAVALVLLLLIGVVATLAFTLWSMTLGRLERKLNLS